MDNLILTQISLSEILSSIRMVVREEISAFNKEANDNKLLSPAEVCKLFSPNISRVTLSNWTKQGYLQQKRLGGRVYYRQEDVLLAAKTLKRYKNK